MMGRMGRREMARMRQLARKLERQEGAVTETRGQLREAVKTAYESGESITAISKELGVTRTRIYQLLGR